MRRVSHTLMTPHIQRSHPRRHGTDFVHSACKSAMIFLHNGGSAVEAVEIAIRSLEDKEITNAGFGSNLTMHGEVECDATLVDHFGRSGAVGAIGSK